jgi:hypothetical protein
MGKSMMSTNSLQPIERQPSPRHDEVKEFTARSIIKTLSLVDNSN